MKKHSSAKTSQLSQMVQKTVDSTPVYDIHTHYTIRVQTCSFGESTICWFTIIWWRRAFATWISVQGFLKLRKDEQADVIGTSCSSSIHLCPKLARSPDDTARPGIGRSEEGSRRHSPVVCQLAPRRVRGALHGSWAVCGGFA